MGSAFRNLQGLQDVFHEPSRVSCWCGRALKLNMSTEGLPMIISVPFSGTSANSILRICRGLIIPQLVPGVSWFVTVRAAFDPSDVFLEQLNVAVLVEGAAECPRVSFHVVSVIDISK